MNLFGAQVKNTLSGSDVNWQALFDQDADDDQYTNGEELGDSGGAWHIGDPNPSFSPTHPADSSSTPCGNGTIEGPETCDTADFAGATCQAEGFAGGALSCTSNCTNIDSSTCNQCGNSVKDDGEECDGDALDGASCQTLGYDQGTLVCAPKTCLLDKTGCSNVEQVVCGDTEISGDEECDGANLGGATCQSQGFDQGTLACTSGTCLLDKSGCTSNTTECGNGVLEAGEQCDGSDFGGKSCQTMGFAAGDLACDPETCFLNQSGCTSPSCGNDLVELDEACDGTDLAGETCVSQGFPGGVLTCTNCNFDIGGCDPVIKTKGIKLIGGCQTTSPGGLLPALILLVFAFLRAERKKGS